MELLLDGRSLTLDDLVAVARAGRRVALAPDARQRMEHSYDYVRQAQQGDDAVYGVNTGFGSLARVRIEREHCATLSWNLVRSHAAGVGPPLSEDVVRATMLLRANALSVGASGCRPLLVETLAAMLNAGVHPVLPSQGSCGSSGDLAPLSHLGLVMAEGEHGEAMFHGERLAAGEAMKRAGILRLRLQAKDGLAITNGAQVTAAIAALCCHDAARLLLAAELAAAMSIEALKGTTRAFHPAVHQLRPYAGARACAANLRRLLAKSSLVDSVPGRVQDAYSLRCTPVVLGASRDTLAFARQQISTELNAVTDNPVILVEEEGVNKAFSAGLFHGEPVGMAADVLKLAVAEIASLSERRLYRLTTGHLSPGLPPALARVDRPQLGLMVPQTTAAALVSENKALAWPASVDSIPTCEDQEDHVAMSTTAARRAARVVANSRLVVAVELLAAAWALAFRQEDGDVTLGEGTGQGLARVRRALGDLDREGPPSELIAALDHAIRSGELTDGLGLEEVP